MSLLILLWVRLDADALNSRFIEQMGHYSNSSMLAEKSSLTFMHGIGLRLDQATIDHPDFQLQAKHINISIRLLPLLLGKIEVDTLDIHDAIFKLKSDALALSATSISTLPVERIHLIRSRIEAADGTPILNNLQLELRGIGTEHETLWELNAQHEHQAFSGHGRILFHQGKIESGFGKVKLANMPVAKLHAFAPTTLMHWLEGKGNNLSGSVTMDLGKHQAWALFGEMMLENAQSKLAVKIRGKLSHLSDGKLEWKDSFIHLDNQAVIAIAGSCEHSSCNTILDAKNIAFKRWHQFIPEGITFHRKISGTTQLMASLQWDEKAWQGKATLDLKQAKFQHGDQTIALPALHIDVNELSGNTTTWNAKANITSPIASGLINVLSNREANGDKNMEIKTHDSDSQLWQPLANLLLSSLGLEPELEASGTIQGSVHLHQHAKNKVLELNIDATPTLINYQPWGNKAANISAVCQADIKLSDGTPYAVNMNDCQLDRSQITKLSWLEKNKRHSLVVENMSLDFDSLHQQSIALPDSLKIISGKLEGSGRSQWKGQQHWTTNMHGEWHLQKIGSQTWQASGDVHIDQGVSRFNQIRIDGIYGKTALKGSYNIASQRGDINVLSSTLDWSKLPELPSFAQHISLRGNIQQTELTLVHNHWQNLHSSYNLSQGSLTLKQFQSTFADGLISSEKLMLSPVPDGLNIQGDLRAKNIQLNQVQGLSEWIQADINGSLQANVILNGRITRMIPDEQWQKTWRRSNGDILIYSGDWKEHKKDESISMRLGIKAPPILQAYAFRKLEFRFRIFENRTDISPLTLIRLEQLYQGKSSISSDLHLSGNVRHKETQSSYIIDSTLPKIHWKKE